MQKIWQNLTQGLRDFCNSNNFSEITLGLSGGLDSALVAALAADAIGGEKVHAVMMKSKYTSYLSLEIARETARLNKLDYQEIDIQPLIDEQTKFLTSFFEEKPKGIVVENLQARERGKILMSLSNQYGYLVLSCSNKSELAMGYCTLYGDMCGGLLPIGNLYKSQIYDLANYRNEVNLVIPKEVILRAPTAELADGQKDENNLPPYKLLDKILTKYIDEHQTIAQIVAEGIDSVLTEKIINKYKSQEFKRRQTAEILKY